MRGGANRWPQEIAEFIYNHYEGRPNKELTVMVNEQFGTNFKVKQICGWKKNHKLSSGLTGYFPKGHMPVNPIQKGQRLGIKTEFKKGNQPLNKVPIGTERFRKGEYLYVKIAEPNVWKAKHRLIWEEAFGPIPENHRLIFLDGNRLNVVLSNLQLVSYATSLIMNRKKLFYSNPELTKIGTKIAEIDLKIQTRKRGEIND